MKPNPSQLLFDFTDAVHRRENNAESESNLNANRFHFTGQVAVVISLLLQGQKLTVKDAINANIPGLDDGVGDLRRRICDIRQALKRSGQDASWLLGEWVRDDKGRRLYKQYFKDPTKTVKIELR
jgi:hypothetical protein